MKKKGQKGNPLKQPLSLHYVTSLTLRIIGEKANKNLSIQPNIVNESEQVVFNPPEPDRLQQDLDFPDELAIAHRSEEVAVTSFITAPQLVRYLTSFAACAPPIG